MLSSAKLDRKGQSTLEYLLVVTAVVAAALGFQGTFRGDLSTTWSDQSRQMVNWANRLGNIMP